MASPSMRDLLVDRHTQVAIAGAKLRGAAIRFATTRDVAPTYAGTEADSELADAAVLYAHAIRRMARAGLS